MKNKNVLVTGALGFIGSQICEGLIKKEYNVFGLSLEDKGARLEALSKHPNFQLVIGDIQDFDSVFDAIRDHQIEAIIHLAALLPKESDKENPFPVFNVNAKGTLNLLNASYKNKVKNFVYASTMSVYMDPPEHLPVDEKHLTMPSSIYGASKLAGELYSSAYSKDIKVAILRYGGAYGKGHYEHGVVYRFIQSAIKNEPIEIYGSGKQTTDFTYIGDIVNATITAMENNIDGIYNIGTGKETSIKDLAEKIIKITKSKSQIVLAGKDTDRPFRFCLDISKAKKDFNYSPISLDDGLKEYISQF